MQHIFLAAAAAALVLASCSRNRDGRIIPRSRMSRIYAEMLLTDQWISTYGEHMREADTSRVYEPVFRRYGYTSDDFRASVAYYLKDTERYGRMVRQATLMLEKKERELKRQKARLDALEALRSAMVDLSPEKFFYLCGLYDGETFVEGGTRFYVDTTGDGDWIFDPYKGIDTLYQGPMLLISAPGDTATHEADTLVVLSDTLAVYPDTLAVAGDSLAAAAGQPAVAVDSIVRPAVSSAVASDSSAAGKPRRPLAGKELSPIKKKRD